MGMGMGSRVGKGRGGAGRSSLAVGDVFERQRRGVVREEALDVVAVCGVDTEPGAPRELCQ